jgi:cytochrome P450
VSPRRAASGPNSAWTRTHCAAHAHVDVEPIRTREQASDAVVEKLDALVEAKQDSPDDDLVTALISARDGEERLNQQQLLSTIFQLIVAGHGTTASPVPAEAVGSAARPL